MSRVAQVEKEVVSSSKIKGVKGLPLLVFRKRKAASINNQRGLLFTDRYVLLLFIRILTVDSDCSSRLVSTR